MEVTCTSCQTRYRIAEGKVPEKGAKAHCPNCGQWILIAAKGKTREVPLSPLPPGVDYGQTIAFNFSEVDQSRTEVGELLEEVSRSDPFFRESWSCALRDVDTGREFLLEKPEVVLGRVKGDISLGDPEVSRRHCTVKVFGDRFVVIDLGSTNGTFFQGRRVVTARLGEGERFTIGNTTLETMVKRSGSGFTGG